MAESLRKQYITFDELTIIPDNIFSNIIRDFDRDDIIKSLVDSKEEIREKFLNNLPQKTKAMVADSLDDELEHIPADEVIKARYSITKKFREMAKNGKIDLLKYAT